MKYLLTITALYLLLSMSQAWSLPPCEGDESNWHNCEGSLTSGSGKVYIGVFKDGIFEGKGEKKILKKIVEKDPKPINDWDSANIPNIYENVDLVKAGNNIRNNNSRRHRNNVIINQILNDRDNRRERNHNNVMNLLNLGTMIIGQWQLR